MPPALLASALALLATLTAVAAPAAACDPVEYLTPVDLADRATQVVVVEVTAAPDRATDRARFRGIETLKGGAATTLVVPIGVGSCDPSLSVGGRGVLFLDAAGAPIGLYGAFAPVAWAPTLRAYLGPAVPEARAAALVDAALGRDWSRSFGAAHALADRVELVLAIDPARRAALVARLARIGRQHPLVELATRLHDPRATAVLRRRGLVRSATSPRLGGVAGGGFEAVSDPAALAAVIGARTSPAQARVAAMERCERVHRRTLARFSDYASAAPSATWAALADACRTGRPLDPIGAAP